MNLVFHDVKLAAGDFSLELNLVLHGKVTGIFGSSGAGKTTILEAVAGLRKLTAGKIELDGKVLCDTQQGTFIPACSRSIGYVPQDLALFPHLTVRRNLEYGMKGEGGVFDNLCEMLEIRRLLDRLPHSLSGGEKQRVAFARALLATPKLLLLDEPLASLDRTLKDRILPYLQRMRRELAIPMIYVTHSPDEIAALCEEVIVLRHGRCVKQGTSEEIFSAVESVQYRLRE